MPVTSRYRGKRGVGKTSSQPPGPAVQGSLVWSKELKGVGGAELKAARMKTFHALQGATDTIQMLGLLTLRLAHKGSAFLAQLLG